MLLELTMKNVALVHELHASLGEGLTIFSGETGAGKSILIGGLTMLMGARADKDNIAYDAEEAFVEGVFYTHSADTLRRLEALGVEAESGDSITIARKWGRSGRGICRVNGHSVPASALRDLGLIDIFGQQDHQSLRERKAHGAMLDRYGGYPNLLGAMKAAYGEWKAAKDALGALDMDEAERARRADMLRFQTEEIEEAALDPDEEDALLAKRSIIRNARNLQEGLALSHAMLDAQEDMEIPSVLDLLRNVSQQLSGFEEIPDIHSLYERVQDALYQLEDVDAEITDQLENLDFDASTAQQVEDRLALLSDIKRKYGADIASVLEYYENASEELDSLLRHDAKLIEYREAEAAARKKLRKAADELHTAREKTAREFEKDVLSQLADLGMGKTRFEVHIERQQRYSSLGNDEIAFLISPNPGIPLGPLEKTASGGEMSRIMLALTNVNVRNKEDICMVFDEIDTGVSGQMAQAVAEKLFRISTGRQVLCVTHLQQLASMGDAHFLVHKIAGEDSTSTEIQQLGEQERVQELARLVGGSEDSARRHAKTLLKEARAFKDALHGDK